MKYVELRRVNTDESYVDLPDYVTLTFDAVWNPSPSTINFTYPLGAGAAAGLAEGAFIAVLPDGVEIPDRFVLETRSKVSVTDNGFVITWGGRSLKALLEDDFVWPSAWPNPVPQGHGFIDVSAGTILKTFLTRSNDRGFMTALTHTNFSGTVDSAGASWGVIVDRNFSNGTTVLQVAQNLYDSGMIELRTNKFRLEVYKPNGLSRHLSADAVSFIAGKNIADESTQSDASNFYTDTFMEGEGAGATATNSSAYGIIGRRRSRYASAGGVADPGTLSLLASTDLAQFTHINQERTLSASHHAGEPQPFVDYRCGDWIWLDVDGTPVELQVQQISVQVQNGNIPFVGLTIGDLLDSADEALKRKMDAITGGNSGNYGPIPGTTATVDLAPAAPTGVNAGFGIYVDDKGVNRVATTISWNEVSTNSDGTTAFDIASYEVFMRDDSPTANWQLIGKSEKGTPVVFYSPLPEGTYKRFQVVAIDQAAHRSAPSIEYRAQTPKDTTGPATPSTPTIAQRSDVTTVSWDGLTSSGGAMDADFSFLEVHRSQTSNFSPSGSTIFARLTGKASIDMTSLPPGTAWFVKFRAVDASGNAGTASAQASFTIGYVPKTDLAQAVRDDIDNALSTAGTANTTANTANTKADNLLTNLNTNYYTKPQTDALITSSSGKNKIVYSTSDASGTVYADGDTWYKMSTLAAGGRVIAMWQFLSGAWVSRAVDGLVIANIDAGSITTGFLDANRIAANALTIGKTAGLQATLDATQQRGSDLVTNGYGLLGDNTNFPGFDFNAADAPTGTQGSFVIKTTANQSTVISENIALDPAKKYRFSFQARQTVSGQTGRMYGFIAPYDAYNLSITPLQYMYVTGTTTTLAAPLNPGNTTITLTSSANWYGSSAKPAGGNSYQRNMIFWDYTDAGGKTWGTGTYSRNLLSSVGAAMWADGGISGNVITLSAPYAGPAKPAGTVVSNSTSGGNYIYMPSATNVLVPETWTTYADDFLGGIMAPSAQQTLTSGSTTWGTGLPPGTAKVRVGWLMNYPSGGGKHAVAAVSLSEGAAAYSLAAQTDALTKGWVNPYPGMVSINGGAILADSIGTTQLQASIIGAKQLVVADTANMAEIQENTAGAVTTAGFNHIIETVSNIRWSKRDVTTSPNFMFRNQVGPLPFKSGERIRLTFDAFADATVAAQPYLWTYGSTNTTTAFVVAPTPSGGSPYPGNITTTAQSFAFEVVVPTLTDQTTFYVGLAGVTGRDVRVRNVRAYRMGAGELVVDGSIEGIKIKANTVTATQIDASTLTLGQSQITGLTTSLAAKTTTFAQGTIPTSTAAGDLWIDTANGNKIYRAVSAGVNTISGSGWVLYTDLTTKTQSFAQGTIPTSTAIGDLWVNTSDSNKLYRAASVGATTIGAGAWVLVNTTFMTQTFAQSATPTAVTAGDIWINTNDSNKMYRAAVVGANTIGAGAWVLVQDPTAKTTTFATGSIPTSTAVGDIWINTSDNNKMYRAAAIGANTIAAGAWVLVDSTFYTKTFAQATIPTSLTIGDIWINTSDNNRMYRAAAAGATTIGAGAWVLVQDPAAKSTTFAQGTIPTSIVIGDLWIDTANGNKMYRAASAGATTIAAGQWVLVNDITAKTSTFAQGTTPTSTAIGDIWVNTSDNNKMYRAAVVGATTIGAGAWVLVDSTFYTKTFAQNTIPTSLTAGDFWVDTGNQNKIYRAFAAGVNTIGASAWVLVQDPTSKTTTFAQGTIPTSTAIGDLWVNTTDSNKIYRSEAIGATTIGSGAWVLVNDLTTKTSTFRQGTIPTSTAVGDTWYNTSDNNRAYVANAIGVNTIVTTGNGWYEVTDFRVNSWTSPGTTKIDGGQLQTNTVVANAIAARTIGADKMIIGGVTNLVPNGACEWGIVGGLFLVGTTGVSIDTGDKPAELNGSWECTAGTTTVNTDSGSYMQFDCDPAQEFYVEVWLKANTANSRMYIEVRDQAGTRNVTMSPTNVSGDNYAAGSGYLINNWIVPTAWTKYTAIMTPQAGTTKIRVSAIYFNHSNGTNTSAIQNFALRIRPRNSGQLIVDGAITAQKMSADSITSSAITAGAITADKLSFGIRGTNLVPDPSFEDTQPANSPTAMSSVVNQNGWYRDSLGSGGAVDLRRKRGRSGSWSVSCYLNGAGGTSSMRSGLISVIPGQVYKLAFYAADGITTGSGLVYQLYGGSSTSNVTTLQTLDSDADFVQPASISTYSPTVDPVEYTAYSFDYTVPAGINYVQIRLGNTHPTGTGSILFDDVSFILKGSPSTEITPAGVRLFDEEGLEVGAFVSNRPNYFSVTRSGVVLASIDEDGSMQGTSGAFAGDGTTTSTGYVQNALTVGGKDISEYLDALPQGIITQVYKSSLVSVTNIRTEYGIYECGFTALPGRHYRVSFSGGTIRANTGAPTVVGLVRIRRTLDGSTPSITNGTIIRSQWVGLPTNNVDVSVPLFSAQGEMTGGSSTAQDVRLLYTVNALNAGTSDWVSFSNKGGTSAPAPIEVVVEDLGYDIPDVYQGNSGGGSLYTGGTTTESTTPPPTVKKTYVQTWTNNSSQTRRGVSVYGNYTVNTAAPSGYNLAGYYSSSNGNQYAYYGFTGTGSLGQTITTAIGGATVTKVELYVKNYKFYSNSGGSQRFSLTSLTGMPSAGSASSTTGVVYTNSSFTTGQGKWITLASDANTRLLSGGRVCIIGPGGSGSTASNSQSYYSTWYASGAQLRVTYVK